MRLRALLPCCLLLCLSGVVGARDLLGVLVVGQSNMVGGNPGPRDAFAGGLDDLGVRVLCMDRDDRLTPWHYPFPFRLQGKESGTSVNVSPAVALVRRLTERYPQHEVCVVFCAQVASGFNNFIPDPERNWAGPQSTWKLPSNLFDITLERVQRARALGVQFVAGVGMLGESDASVMNAAEFAHELDLLVSGLRRATGPIPWAFGSMPQWKGSPFADLTEIDAGLLLASQVDPLLEVAWADGLTPDVDLAHFDTPSARTMGERMYAALDAGGALPSVAPLGLAPPHAAPVVGPPVRQMWTTLLHQDFANGVWFESYGQALTGAALGPDQRSHLAQLEQYRRASGEFVLKAQWGTGIFVVWSQTSNPFDVPRDEVTGLKALNDPWGLISGGFMDGLCRTTATGALLSFRRHAVGLAAPSCGLFLYNEYKLAQSAGFSTVLSTPTGTLTDSITLLVLSGR